MASAPRGYIEWHGHPETGRWRTRATDREGRRVWILLPYELRQNDRARAKRVAQHIQLAAHHIAHGARALPADGESVEEYAVRWSADRRARGRTNADLDASTLAKHLYPPLGARPLASITRADLETFVRGLDERVRVGKISWKTATNVWGLARKLFNDAASSKTPALRVLDASPARDVPGPDRGRRRMKQFLWPAEVAELLSCTAVPLAWRRVYACAVYLGTRAGELAALRPRDVDRRRWVISIHQAAVTRGSPIKARRRAPKTQAGTRAFAAELAIRPLLDALCREAIDDAGPLVRPFRTDGPDGASTRLREHLHLAGVRRPELHEPSTETRKRLTFHDLRATYCTWCAIRGDDAMRIRARAGHEDIETTLQYVRAAGMLDSDLVGEVFPALPDCLVTPFDVSPGVSPSAAQASEVPAPQGDAWRPQRDSKPLPAPHGSAQSHDSGRLAPDDRGDTGLSRGDTSHAGTIAGTDPDAALRAAAQAAIAAGDLDLAGEILALLRSREQACVGVVDLEAARRRRSGGS